MLNKESHTHVHMPYKDPARAREHHREYMHAHPEMRKIDYENHKKERRAYLNDYIRRLRLEMKAWLLEQKTGKSCVECGLSDPKRLDFHHVDMATKVDSISHMLQSTPGPAGIKRAIEEMKKCVLLCKSCHAKKSVGRFGWMGVRENVRRYPLARCLYMAHWARQNKKVGGY